MVALGYGIVQPILSPGAWGGLFTFTLIYGIVASMSTITDIATVQGGGSVSADETYAYKIAELVTESIFVLWFTYAWYATIKLLISHQQKDKLWKYQLMAASIGTYLPGYLVFSFVAFLRECSPLVIYDLTAC
jgi:hypothetical protein